jgi:hypothetical protein
MTSSIIMNFLRRCFSWVAFVAWSVAHGSDHSKMIRWETQALNLKFEQIGEWPGVEYQPMPNAEIYLCASLEKVLATNGVLMGHHLHGDRLTEMVIVYAKDGYKVSFSLSELDAVWAVSYRL